MENTKYGERDGYYDDGGVTPLPVIAEPSSIPGKKEISRETPKNLSGCSSLACYKKPRCQMCLEMDAQFAAATEKDKLLSDKRGSAARFNVGKLDYSLVPLKLMALSILQEQPESACARALFLLGCYQASRDARELYAVARELGQPGWAECAQVFDYGQRKYAPWNWAKGMPWSSPLSSAVRHLMAMLAGEFDDAESGLPHRGHVFCNLVMLLTYSSTYVEGDDFAPAGALA